jgi:hypothetical protein
VPFLPGESIHGSLLPVAMGCIGYQKAQPADVITCRFDMTN